jgi:hypothetical protein
MNVASPLIIVAQPRRIAALGLYNFVKDQRPQGQGEIGYPICSIIFILLQFSFDLCQICHWA